MVHCQEVSCDSHHTLSRILQYLICGLAFLTPYGAIAAPLAIVATGALVSIFFKWRWGLYVYVIICSILMVLMWIPFIIILANNSATDNIIPDMVYVFSILVQVRAGGFGMGFSALCR